jgi:hypothetical protein
MNRIEREEATNPRLPSWRYHVQRTGNDADAAAPAPVRQQQPRRRENPYEVDKPGDYFMRALVLFILLMLLESPFWIWQKNRIGNLTRPLSHKHYTEHKRDLEWSLTLGLVIPFTIFFTFFGLAILFLLSPAINASFMVPRRNYLVRGLIFLLVSAFCFFASWNVFLM